jgi:hypothetical protein
MWVLLISLVATWIVWLVFLAIYSRQWNRIAFYKRICQHLIAGSLFELLVSIPPYIFSKGSLTAIFFGISVILSTFGLATIWLMMRRVIEKLEAEKYSKPSSVDEWET